MLWPLADHFEKQAEQQNEDCRDCDSRNRKIRAAENPTHVLIASHLQVSVRARRV